jgi:predicted DNA-binding protein (MmcQ/YjbR family)
VTTDDFNRFCAAFPATSHVVQWGGAQVWKVGGKVFAIGGWGEDSPAFTFKVSPLSFEMLKALPGLRPAPYLASRGMSWIQRHGEPGLGDGDLKAYIRESHRLVGLGLGKRKRRELGLE